MYDCGSVSIYSTRTLARTYLQATAATFHVGCLVVVQNTFTTKANLTPTEMTKGLEGELVAITASNFEIKWQDGSTNHVYKIEFPNIELVFTSAQIAAQVCM